MTTPRSKAAATLTAAGFRIVKAYRGARWFIVRDEQSDAQPLAVFYVQGPACWHWFDYAHAATGSGCTPRQAARGGLGDVIDSDSALRSYCRAVLAAPADLDQCRGLSAAQSQAYAEAN